VKKHFVEFFSPGTLVAETSVKSMHAWDVDSAVEMAKDIKERYDAMPYAFQFFTKERNDDDLDSKEVARSGYYFLGGSVMTLHELELRADPDERILRDNMKRNGYDRVVINRNSWKWTQALEPDDVVLPV
jgi:hypothetical protein